MNSDERIAAAFERIATALEERNKLVADNHAKVNDVAEKFLTLAIQSVTRPPSDGTVYPPPPPLDIPGLDDDEGPGKA